MRWPAARLNSFAAIATFLLVVAALYWGQPILMPLALAVLLTFLLSPAVTALRRRGLKQAPAVNIVVILAFSLLGGIIMGIGHQLNNLANELPKYKDNVRQKIQDLRVAGQGMPLEKVQNTIKELAGELNQENVVTGTNVPNQAGTTVEPESLSSKEKPLPVVVHGKPTESSWLSAALGPISNLLATAGLVIVLVIFMLLRREELRDRLILLGGFERLPITTRILREAGQRISRYLLTQSFINAVYGLAVGIGLYLIGLPYALLWAFFAAIVRFIPYVGPWLGALLPIALALAVFPGWLYPLLVIALYVVAELIANMLLEPIFYGQSAGVSEVALLVALAFWTWIWGPIGLVLGTPLTVCLVVLAKYVPRLEFIHSLMGDEPMKEKGLIYYERLLAKDAHEAKEIVQRYLNAHSPLQACDDLLLPALIFSRRDRAKGKCTPQNEQFVFRNVRELLEQMDFPADKNSASARELLARRPGDINASTKFQILALPIGDEAEELALLMVKKAVMEWRCETEILSFRSSPDEVLSLIQSKRPDLVCVGVLPPEDTSRSQHLIARLREECPHRKVVIGHWGLNGDANLKLVRSLGAEYAGTTLADTCREILAAAARFLSRQNFSQRDLSDSPAVMTAHSTA